MNFNNKIVNISIIVPTYNERKNIEELLILLQNALKNLSWEIIFVDDDSPDGTHFLIKEIAQQNLNVRCIRRIGRRGLAGACVEGILSSSAPVVMIMDADLQHDETIIPFMNEALQNGADIVVGSRYRDGGLAVDGFSKTRQWGSLLATTLGNKLIKADVKDSMSGFFMMRRELFDEVAPNLSKDGFKLLLDILASVKRPIKAVEVPYTFRSRLNGESKLDSLVTIDYLGLLLSKISGGLVPVRFLMFAIVGASGVIIHLISLSLFLKLSISNNFSYIQLYATFIAMTWNFVINNIFTFRDLRLKGFNFIRGLFSFYLACSIGTIANIGASAWIYDFNQSPIAAGFAGAILGAVFNYVVTSMVTWKK